MVRCRKKHKGKVVRARGKRPHRARTALCTARTARAPFFLQACQRIQRRPSSSSAPLSLSGAAGVGYCRTTQDTPRHSGAVRDVCLCNVDRPLLMAQSPGTPPQPQPLRHPSEPGSSCLQWQKGAKCPSTGGRSDSNPDPNPLPNFLGPVVGGAQWGGVPGTPTYVPQNDPLVALIISNTHMWGFLEKKLPPGGPIPAARSWGGGGGLAQGLGGGWGGGGRAKLQCNIT